MRTLIMNLLLHWVSTSSHYTHTALAKTTLLQIKPKHVLMKLNQTLRVFAVSWTSRDKCFSMWSHVRTMAVQFLPHRQVSVLPTRWSWSSCLLETLNDQAHWLLTAAAHHLEATVNRQASSLVPWSLVEVPYAAWQYQQTNKYWDAS